MSKGLSQNLKKILCLYLELGKPMFRFPVSGDCSLNFTLA